MKPKGGLPQYSTPQPAFEVVVPFAELDMLGRANRERLDRVVGSIDELLDSNPSFSSVSNDRLRLGYISAHNAVEQLIMSFPNVAGLERATMLTLPDLVMAEAKQYSRKLHESYAWLKQDIGLKANSYEGLVFPDLVSILGSNGNGISSLQSYKDFKDLVLNIPFKLPVDVLYEAKWDSSLPEAVMRYCVHIIKKIRFISSHENLGFETRPLHEVKEEASSYLGFDPQVTANKLFGQRADAFVTLAREGNADLAESVYGAIAQRKLDIPSFGLISNRAESYLMDAIANQANWALLFREEMQNSIDAGASKVDIQITIPVAKKTAGHEQAIQQAMIEIADNGKGMASSYVIGPYNIVNKSKKNMQDATGYIGDGRLIKLSLLLQNPDSSSVLVQSHQEGSKHVQARYNFDGQRVLAAFSRPSSVPHGTRQVITLGNPEHGLHEITGRAMEVAEKYFSLLPSDKCTISLNDKPLSTEFYPFDGLGNGVKSHISNEGAAYEVDIGQGETARVFIGKGYGKARYYRGYILAEEEGNYGLEMIVQFPPSLRKTEDGERLIKDERYKEAAYAVVKRALLPYLAQEGDKPSCGDLSKNNMVAQFLSLATRKDLADYSRAIGWGLGLEDLPFVAVEKQLPKAVLEMLPANYFPADTQSHTNCEELKDFREFLGRKSFQIFSNFSSPYKFGVADVVEADNSQPETVFIPAYVADSQSHLLLNGAFHRVQELLKAGPARKEELLTYFSNRIATR